MMPRTIALSAAACLVFPTFSLGQTNGPSADARASVMSCLDSTDPSELRECIGAYSDACWESAEGQTTQGMTECLTAEAEIWDEVLNTNYQERLSEAEDLDAERQSQGSDGSAAAEGLRSAQRAWIAFRDAECDRIFELNKDGTIRLPATASCTNRLTAERALALADTQG